MIIRPISDLRNTNDISEQAHKSGEPIFITKNGYGDMVLMSMELFEQKYASQPQPSQATETQHISKSQMPVHTPQQRAANNEYLKEISDADLQQMQDQEHFEGINKIRQRFFNK